MEGFRPSDLMPCLSCPITGGAASLSTQLPWLPPASDQTQRNPASLNQSRATRLIYQRPSYFCRDPEPLPSFRKETVDNMGVHFTQCRAALVHSCNTQKPRNNEGVVKKTKSVCSPVLEGNPRHGEDSACPQAGGVPDSSRTKQLRRGVRRQAGDLRGEEI